MNRASLKKLIITALVIAALSGGSYYGYTKFFKAKPVSQARFITAAATKGTLDVTVPGTGTVISAATKDVIATGNGTLNNFTLKVGSTVKQGDSIGTIVDPSLQFQIQGDQLKLNQAKQQLDQIKKQQALQIQADQIKIAQQKQKISQDTNQTAIDNDTLTLQQLQNSLDNDTASQSQSINNQNANIEQLQNALNNDLAAQSRETLTAPISGKIVTLNNQNGDTVQNGKTIATIIDMDHLQLDVPVDELDINNVKPGQKVDISFDDIKDKKYTGSVVSVADVGKTTNNVTTYDVIVDINNPDGVKLGMNANVTIDVQSKDNVLMVPVEAIQTRNGKKYVMEPSLTSNNGQSTSNGGNSNGNGGNWSGGNSRSQGGRNSSGGSANRTAVNGKRVEVQTGLTNENYVEITSGLKEGDRVLITIPNVSSSSQNRQQSGGGFGGGSFGGGGFSGGGFGGGGNRGD